jgi:hypothetical protein
MQRPETTSVGIVPIGALGVAFYHYLTAGARESSNKVVFLSRRAASENNRWVADASVRMETAAGRQDLPLAGRLAGSLPDAAAGGRLPEVILVCTNPDQLFDVVADYVAVVEYEHRKGRLESGTAHLPLLVLCANGIYFQRIRSSFVELLEESTLLGRLPDLWPHLMPTVVGRLMRGVTIQTASRNGAGSTAVYRPGPPGRTQLTGGDRLARAEAARQLTACGGWFEDVGDVQPTRVEFNKALVNLAMNVIGQLAAIDADGRFRMLTVGEITQSVARERILELVEAVMRVGQGVGVFAANESSIDIFAHLEELLRSTAAHVPSSLQLLGLQLRAGTVGPGLAPTEKWLLQPLLQYARSLGDAGAIRYFEGLEKELTDAIARAARTPQDRRLGLSETVPGPKAGP